VLGFGNGLLYSLDVVLGKLLVLLLLGTGSFLEFGQTTLKALLGSNSLVDDSVKGRKGTTLEVNHTSRDAVGLTFLIKIVHQGELLAGTFIENWLLGALGEKLDGGEASDTMFLSDLLACRVFRIDLSNDDLVLQFKGNSEVLILGLEALAVCGFVSELNEDMSGDWLKLTTAPWSSECNQNVLRAIHGLVEGLVVKLHDQAWGLLLFLVLETSLFGDKLDKVGELTPASILLGGLGLSGEPLECGEALDAVLLAQVLVCVGIYLGNEDLVLVVSKGLGEGLIGGSEILAVWSFVSLECSKERK